jgi:hypothetical protein
MNVIQDVIAVTLAVAIFIAALSGGELLLIDMERKRMPQSLGTRLSWLAAESTAERRKRAWRRRAHRVLVWILAVAAAGLVLLVFWDGGRLVFAKGGLFR